MLFLGYVLCTIRPGKYTSACCKYCHHCRFGLSEATRPDFTRPQPRLPYHRSRPSENQHTLLTLTLSQSPYTSLAIFYPSIRPTVDIMLRSIGARGIRQLSAKPTVHPTSSHLVPRTLTSTHAAKSYTTITANSDQSSSAASASVPSISNV